ncbi:MAG: Uma2 family endonuclease [Treponema sp.]|jgi:Uma2 family endonuclease|nr:Uma2 family endonuclease [Treponema sp.]
MSTVYEKNDTARYTYADYLVWDTEERYELLDGEAYMLSAPTVTHQAVSRELIGQFGNFLKGKSCQVFAAPFDVRLFPREDGGDDTVVQPDLLVVCDKSKIADNRACRGAPDLVIEILSPSNDGPAMFLKYNRYLTAGVREYWVISPETREIQVHILDRGDENISNRYISTLYTGAAALGVSVLPGLNVDFNTIWSEL